MKKEKASQIKVKDYEVSIVKHNERDYISLTDMLKAKDGDFFISDWLRNRNTVEFLGIWESLNNPNFNYGEFAIIRSQAGLSSYKISVKEWAEKTNAIGIISKTGRYGGTYAHSDIAFEFGTWISPEFKLYLIKEFQRLKEQEQKLLNPEWDYRRFLSKLNYRLHTDAIKDNIIPRYHNLSKDQEGYIYAEEAEILNFAVFGTTSRHWRSENMKEVLQGYNLRDIATIPQLTVLANLESLNAHLISEGLSPKQRLTILKDNATQQLKTLMERGYPHSILSPNIEKEISSDFDRNLRGILSVLPEKEE